jgi:aspartyl-tRNA(Asn)/glutamyl-tRNA(Gln) amidotransferase subunit C
MVNSVFYPEGEVSMAITREEVLHVARLARLSLPESEADRLRGELSAILDYVKQLDRLDTRDVVPTSHAIETGTPFRDDVVEPFGDREALLANAPDRQNDFFRVPRIIED